MEEREKRNLVFISHSSKDKIFVRRLVSDLESAGIKVWIDEQQILVGESIVEKIAEGLAQCTHLIIVLSPNFLASDWCKTELRVMLHREIKRRGKHILPIQIGPIPERAWEDPPLIFMEDILRLDFQGTAYQENFPLLLGAFTPNTNVPKNRVEEFASVEDRINELLKKIDDIKFYKTGIMYTFEFDSIDVQEEAKDVSRLAFITEEYIYYINYIPGLSLNFSLRNLHSGDITVFDLAPEVIRFFDEHSEPFERFVARLPGPILGMSAPIITQFIRVSLSRDPKKCKAHFSWGEESAASRAILSPFDPFRKVDPRELDRYAKMQALMMKEEDLRAETEIRRTGLPPWIRFVTKPGESDAFHCQITGEEKGIYLSDSG